MKVTRIAIPLGLLLTIFIYISFTNHNVKINFTLVLLSAVIYFLVVVLRSIKLKLIVPNLNLSKSLTYMSCSQLLSAFVPGRAGEFVLSTLLKIKFSLNISKVLPTLFIDKLIELLFVCSYCSAIGFLFYRRLINKFLNDIQINWVVVVAIIVVAVIAVFLLLKLSHLFMNKLSKIIINVREGLIIPITNKKLGFSLLFLSALVISLEYLYLFTIFQAYNINISYFQIVIVHSLGMLIGIISLVPGGQGTTEVSMIAILLLWGYNSNVVLAPLLTSKILTYIILSMLSLTILSEAISIIKSRKKRKGEPINE